jgi:hypothetical protein
MVDPYRACMRMEHRENEVLSASLVAVTDYGGSLLRGGRSTCGVKPHQQVVQASTACPIEALVAALSFSPPHVGQAEFALDRELSTLMLWCGVWRALYHT